ncbi:ENT domain [Dillenia turbinata]|uniref:ENT domain n=1 Tax=Dillenia turbinata TaxID=194707 RepID=A0AAN8V1D3_9MAGN
MDMNYEQSDSSEICEKDDLCAVNLSDFSTRMKTIVVSSGLMALMTLALDEEMSKEAKCEISLEKDNCRFGTNCEGLHAIVWHLIRRYRNGERGTLLLSHLLRTTINHLSSFFSFNFIPAGTDDDLPPRQKRFATGAHAMGNRHSAPVSSGPFAPGIGDMERHIHHIEQEGYFSILRAFKAQSDAITWEKESLITELRKELKVTDEEHRVLLSRVNADEIIRRIREWRKAGASQPSLFGAAQSMHVPVPSPSVSATCKKQKMPQAVASISLGAPSPAVQPSSSVPKRGPVPGSSSKKPKSVSVDIFLTNGVLHAACSLKSMQHDSAGGFAAHGIAAVATIDPLIGRKVMTRWPEDNNFYEATITDYNPVEGLHALVYDMNTADETWEWVNLKEISRNDIRWEDEDPGISCGIGHVSAGRGKKKSLAKGGTVNGAGRGRGNIKAKSKKEYPSMQNGTGKKSSSNIEIMRTDTLIEEVEKVFSAAHPDPVMIEKAKKALREQEEALIKAVARLEDASDGESDEEEQHFLQGHQPLDQAKHWSKRECNEMGGEDRMLEGSEDEKIAREIAE